MSGSPDAEEDFEAAAAVAALGSVNNVSTTYATGVQMNGAVMCQT